MSKGPRQAITYRGNRRRHFKLKRKSEVILKRALLAQKEKTDEAKS